MALLLLTAATVPERRFAIAAGSLGDALVALAQQSQVSIGASDPALDRVRVRGLRGSYTPEQALRRLLAGTGFGFVKVDASTFRVVRAPPRDRPPAPRTLPQPPLAAPEAPQEIIVIASKRGAALSSFPATVDIVDLSSFERLATAQSGTEDIAARLPMLATTHLGPGRNKLFIRGVADSSFTGPTQATVGQYLGDVRLNYNAPDPNLSLYDIGRVELVEGPQGTLYGAGSLGGVLRLVPNEPRLDRTEGSAAIGASQTVHGDPSYDAAGMINVPVLAGKVGVRLVGYRSVEGGYIDDAGRGLNDINRTRTAGGRASVRIAPGDDWTIDVGGVLQSTVTRDSQYALRRLPPLTRSSAIAQPFDNDFALLDGVTRKSWGSVDFVSATGLVRHDVDARYDATGFDGGPEPMAFDEDNHITLLTHETRLSRRGAGGTGWIVGAALVSDTDRITRRMGPVDRLQTVVGVRNETLETALFGEASFKVSQSLTATVGGRATYSHLSGEPLALKSDEFELDRGEFRFLPTAAVAWRLRPHVLAFVRYQQGFRAGGLGITQTPAAPIVTRYRADRITTIEAGLRVGRQGTDRFSGSATLSYARWRDIQADVIEPSSLPSTANIGNGRIYGLEASAQWTPVPAITADLSIFLNDSGLADPATGFGDADVDQLPNIARAGASAGLSWSRKLSERLALKMDVLGRYVGASKLGVSPGLEVSQGDYVETGVSLRLESGDLGVGLDVTNAGDLRGNRFSLGNPFAPPDHRQVTPLRPLTVRLGLSRRF